jgi:hypothetical protein
VIDYVGKWTVRAELPAKRLLGWIGLPTSKYHLWRQHYGRPHAHNARIPRDGWLEAWEKQAIIDYHRRFPLEGYRRLAYMMLDQDVVAVSPTSVYRVLKGAGLLDRNRWAPSKKGKGFVQPLQAHEHWHISAVSGDECRSSADHPVMVARTPHCCSRSRRRSTSSSSIQRDISSAENTRGSGTIAPSARSREARKSISSCFSAGESETAVASISARVTIRVSLFPWTMICKHLCHASEEREAMAILRGSE